MLHAPFSGKNYDQNRRQVKDGSTPCALCGRGVREPWPASVVVVDGGARFLPVGEVEMVSDPGYMGNWPVGRDCARKLAGYVRA